MQTVETLNEGLKRAFKLTIPASEIDARVEAQVSKVAPQMKMPGFRPGKVPANLVRKMHGPALRQEALQAAVQEGVQSAIAGNGLRPAIQPEVALDENYQDGGDAEVSITLEVLPDVPAPQIDGLTLERLTVPAEDAAIDEQIVKIAAGAKRHEAAPEGHAATAGDLVVMDYKGVSEGVAFEGGTGEGMSVELGSGRLIPGFEEQLEGIRQGESRTLDVTFPDDYPAKNLAGKPAQFDVTVTEVKVPAETQIDDEFAKQLGLESLEQLRGLVRGQVEQELNGLTRTHMKRKLLDQLAAGHDFPVPPSMVDAEFDQIWAQLEHEAGHEADPEAAKAELEGDREDYRRIAERRVRLGLLLSEIGQANGVEITAQERQRAILQAAQQYRPEDRDRFMQYVQQEPMAAAQLTAPIFEDKVVDFLFGRAEVTDRAVTREELEAAIESEDGFATGTHVHEHHDHDHDHHDHDTPKPKRARKAKAEPAADDEAAPAGDVEVAPAGDGAVEVAPRQKAATRKAAAPAEAGEQPADAGAGADEAKPRAKRARKAEAADPETGEA